MSSAGMKVDVDNRRFSVGGNQLSPDALRKLLADTINPNRMSSVQSPSTT